MYVTDRHNDYTRRAPKKKTSYATEIRNLKF